MVVLDELDLLSTIEGASYIDLTIILVKHEVPRCGLDKEQVNVSAVFLEQHTICYLEWTVSIFPLVTHVMKLTGGLITRE